MGQSQDSLFWSTSVSHELFLRKNKNDWRNASNKFAKDHRREVGIVSNGGLVGIEDLVLNRPRSSTVIVNSHSADVVYIPLQHKDIFDYLDEKIKQ